MKKLLFIIVLLLSCVCTMSAQSVVAFAGQVMTKDGEPVIGATVQVKGQPGVGVVTDADGHFRLNNLKIGQTVTFSYIGYTTIHMPVKKTDERMRVILSEDVKSTDEVVVVGQGTQRKISVVGAITTVETKDLNTPATSVANMLGGRVPGIISVLRTGEPGNDFSQFWIRGISTFGANASALVLIDGVEGNINDLDPEDIESFSVLKDASATAVYGTRGANGVVIVTTKKGTAGKLNINAKANVGYSYSPRMPEYLRAYDYATLANEAAASRDMDPIFNGVDLALFKNGLDPDLHPDVDWHNTILRDHSWNQQAHLSASGGGQVARYYMSLGFINKEALMKQAKGVTPYSTNVNYRQYNFRANVDVNMTKSTILNLGLETTIVTQNYPGYGNSTDALWQAASNLTPITVPLRYSSGEYPAYGSDNNQISPYVLLNLTGYRNTYRSNTKIRVSIDQDLSKITKGLKASVLFNFDANSYINESRTKWPTLYYASQRKRDGSLDLIKKRDYQSQAYGNSVGADKKYYFEAHLNYDRVFGQDHRTSGLIHFYCEDYTNSENKSLLTAIPKRYVALSSRLTYSYKDTYFSEFNLGYTGSEAFEKGHRFGLFPAISGGWIPSQYEFVKKALPFLTYLKFRGSYGIVGNDRVSGSTRFPYLYLMGTGGSGPWNSGTGLTETQIGSNNLRWEKATKVNLGIDLKMFREKFDMTVDFFRDVRSGIYQQRASTPAEMGLPSLPWANVGEMKSWGIDGHVSYKQELGRDTYFVLRGNFTQSKNKVTNWEETIKKYPYQRWTGVPYGIPRGLIALGLFNDDQEISESPRQQFESVVRPGDIKYKDVNGYGVVNSDDIVPLKYSSVPQIQYGFAQEFNYKNWNVSVLFEGVARVNYTVGGAGYIPFINKETGNILTIVGDQRNRWTSRDISGDPSTENPNAKFPRLSYGANNNNDQASTFWLRDGSYVRLKYIQISYLLKKPWMQAIGMNSATISLIGDNLWIWDKGDKIFDPAQASGNGATYPLQRVFSLQVNVSF